MYLWPIVGLISGAALIIIASVLGWAVIPPIVDDQIIDVSFFFFKFIY